MMLDTINRILFKDLRPWLLNKEPQVKFKMLLSELEVIKHKFQPAYEVEWIKPVSARQEYFMLLIENDVIAFLNHVYGEMSNTTNEKERAYLISKQIKQIKTLNLDLAFLLNSVPSSKDSEFVLQFLKHELVRLYLEVLTEEKNPNSIIEADDLYQAFYFESAPSPALILDASPIEIDKPLIQIQSQKQGDSFVPVLDDVRPEIKGIHSYDKIIKNPKRFAEFELSLYQQGFIDEEYNFTHTHGLKNELAAIYHELIAKDYFLPRDFEKLKEIKPRDVRKFLDYRYNVNLDKQFRTKSTK
jgi:hypothetical protein